jgi:hypothetical protein
LRSMSQLHPAARREAGQHAKQSVALYNVRPQRQAGILAGLSCSIRVAPGVLAPGVLTPAVLAPGVLAGRGPITTTSPPLVHDGAKLQIWSGDYRFQSSVEQGNFRPRSHGLIV